MGNWAWISSSSSNLLLSAVTTGYRSTPVLWIYPVQGYSPLQLKASHGKYLLLFIFPKPPQMVQNNKHIIESNLILSKAKSLSILSAMSSDQIAKRSLLYALPSIWIKVNNTIVTARLALMFLKCKKKCL